MDTPALTLPPDQESPATVQDILMHPRRGDGERVEETHEQLERIEQELIRLSTFVRQHARSMGLRPARERVVPVANLDALARSGPPGEDIITWSTPPTGGRMESVDNMLTPLEAATEPSENGSPEELEDDNQRAKLSDTPLAPTPESWSRPTPPLNTPAPIFTPMSAGRRSESSSIRPNLPPPSFLSVPDGSRSILAQVTNAELLGSLNDLRRIMDRFIRRQQITNDTLEDLRGRISVQQMEGLGVGGLASNTQALNHISQSLGAIADQLHTGSGGESTELSAPFRSPIALDAQNDAIVPESTPQIGSAPCSPLPQPPSIRLAPNPALTSPPSSSSAAYPRTHAANALVQQPSIWRPRARRVVPRRRVFSEPTSSAWQTASGLCKLREQERERAPDDSGTPSIASRRPSILRSHSPDRTPLSSAQSKTSGKPNVLTGIRPTVCCVQLSASPQKCLNAIQYQRSVSVPIAHEGVDVKSKPKGRSVAWASPLVSVRLLAITLVSPILTFITKDFNTFETSRARTDSGPQIFLGDPQVVSTLYPPVDFQELLQHIKACPSMKPISLF